MEFDSPQAIYLQIADLVCENILRGAWRPGERILSIRDMAMELSVNPNTVVKTYNYLQDQGIIVNQRGIGFFVAEKGHDAVVRLKKENFLSKESQRFFRMMDLLNISWDDLRGIYDGFKKKDET